ncbi:phage portal protein [Escherichia coli]|nr:phage portal protein [Escherichia coli]
MQAYEAVKTTRTHKARRENRTADQLSQYGAVSLREQARYLDNNHDLVIGVFDKLEERVVGKNGIIVEPHPVLRNGAIARDLAAEIRTRWSEWSVSPEVTGQFTRPMLERLMLRTWLRDGEVFAQMVSGRINSLTPSAGVHFWLEALEPDFIPMTSDESNRLNQGVFVDDWGRPEKYLVYKSRPVSGRQMETKEVDAERMLHLKFVRRLHQMRGTSLLSGVLIRLSALKEYEDSELTAARVAAALGMYIRKGDGQSYETDGNDSKENERELTIQPGIIYDDLKPGEEIGMVKSDRPNPNLETFRNAQLRAVAAGSRLSFSSTARNYNGTYSAQRQELVESTDGYLILQDWFIGAVTRPMYRAWLKQAVASGVIRLPRDLDRSSLYTAVYSGPVMPWIDPVKEAEAWKIQIRGGAATESDWVSGAPAWASEHQSTLSAGYLHASTNVPGSDDLNGINVKYRYEFTDTLGLVTSFSYAGDKNRQLTRYSDTRWHEDSVRNRWFSVMAGPSVRVNEWFSAYAMAGVAYSRVSTFSGDYLRVTDNKGKKHDVLTGSDDGRHSNTSLAWGAGVQFNPTESVAIDIAYEGSGSGDWRTDGFIVGVGYKF